MDTQHADNADLLAEIEAALARTGEAETAFGYRIMRDKSLIATLRRGRDVKRSTERRIRAALEEERAEKPATGGVAE